MRFALIGIAALCLVSCSTVSGVAVPSQGAQVAIAQTGLAIDASYNAAAQAYLAVAPSLDKATHDKVKALLVNAYACVVAADAAAKLGDATTLGAQIAAASSLITQASALLHPTS